MNKKYLVLGGGSYIAKNFIEILSSEKQIVDVTFFKSLVKNGLKVDINDRSDANNLIKKIHNTKYDGIISFIGKLSNDSKMKNKESILLDLMLTNFISQVNLVEKLIENNVNVDCNIVFMSSISGINGSFDAPYAASKGALNSYVKSRQKNQHKESINFNAVCPTLIENSGMYKRMTDDEIQNHKARNKSMELIKIQDVTATLMHILKFEGYKNHGEIMIV